MLLKKAKRVAWRSQKKKIPEPRVECDSYLEQVGNGHGVVGEAVHEDRLQQALGVMESPGSRSDRHYMVAGGRRRLRSINNSGTRIEQQVNN